MRKLLLSIALVMCTVPFAHASNVGVSIGVNIGGPSAVYVNPPVTIAGPPLFLQPPKLGFYVAVGVGYDLFRFGNVYYLNNGNNWYSSPYYNGPWAKVQYKHIPYGIRKHPHKRIQYYRDDYYRKYKAGKDYHHYKQFRPKSHKHSAAGYGKHDDDRGYNAKHNNYDKGGKGKHDKGGHGHGNH